MFDEFISPRKGPGDVTWRVATKLEDARTLSPSDLVVSKIRYPRGNNSSTPYDQRHVFSVEVIVKNGYGTSKCGSMLRSAEVSYFSRS